MGKKYSLLSYLFVISFGYLSTGLAIPVLGILLDTKGYSLFYLGWAIFCYSGTVLIFEVPSGLFCDTKGRRNSYIAGLIFLLIGNFCILSQSLLIILIGFSFLGLGKAFGSGSLDALLIERHLASKQKLESAMVAKEISTSISLALGSFLGGFLLVKGKQGIHLCDLVISVRLILIIIHIFLVFLLIANDDAIKQKKVKLRKQTSLLFKKIKETPFIFYFVLFTGVEGILLVSIESYWQPFLKELLKNNNQLWLLGFVGGTVFLISILGSIIGKLLLKKANPSTLFILFLMLTFIGEIFLAFVSSPLFFCIVYSGIYLSLGIVSIVGEVVLNKTLDSSIRSSALSLNSLLLQVGGLLGTAIALPVLKLGSISIYWIIIASLGLIILSLLGKPFSKAYKKRQIL